MLSYHCLLVAFAPTTVNPNKRLDSFRGFLNIWGGKKSNSQLLTPTFLEKMTMHMENCMYWMSLHYLHTYTHTQRLCHGSSTWGGRLEEFVVVREHLSKGLQLLFMRRLHLQQERQGVSTTHHWCLCNNIKFVLHFIPAVLMALCLCEDPVYILIITYTNVFCYLDLWSTQWLTLWALTDVVCSFVQHCVCSIVYIACTWQQTVH